MRERWSGNSGSIEGSEAAAMFLTRLRKAIVMSRLARGETPLEAVRVGIVPLGQINEPPIVTPHIDAPTVLPEVTHD